MEESLKATRKHFSGLGGMFFLGTIIIYAVQLILMRLIQAFRPEWLKSGDISFLLSIIPMYLIGMPALIALVKKIPAEAVEKRPMKWWQFLVAAIMCYGLVYGSNLVGTVLSTVIGQLKGSAVENAIANVAASVSMPLIILYMVICAPFMEEYVFRRLIVERTIKYGQGTAVILSGLMFGLFHGNLNQFVYAFTLGCFLAFLYVKTGKLKITIALHMMINFMGSVVSLKLLDMIDLERYMEIVLNGMDMDALMSFVADNMLGVICYMLYVFFVFGSILAALVLFIVFLATKKFTFARGQVVIPRGRRFRTVILNLGMSVYCIFWIARIVIQLLGWHFWE